ncbi:hypothetical protein FSP39_017042 [Pinctada imbricata]|uniref:Uncharacterized protein n=1 Tax=Pinctada imbricata TaxID=66713 RepID=A0AA89BQ13_PINIB|nr:hypothetical protein FSP39_017042 [Pinctada imbricata]
MPLHSEAPPSNGIDVSNLQSQIKSYEEFTQQLQSQIQSLTEKADVSYKELHSKSTELSQLQEKYSALLSGLVRAETVKSELHSQLVTLEEEVASYERTLSDKEALCSELQSQIMVLSQQVQSKEESDSVTDSEKERIISDLSENLKQANETLRTKEEIISQLEERSASFDELLQSLQTEVRSKTELVNQLQSSVTSYETEKGVLEEEKQSLSKDLELTSEKIVELSDKLVTQEEELSKLKHELHSLCTELSLPDSLNTSQTLNSIRQSVISTNTEKEELRSHLSKLESEKDKNIYKQSTNLSRKMSENVVPLASDESDIITSLREEIKQQAEKIEELKEIEEQYQMINEELNEAVAENEKLQAEIVTGNVKANLFDKRESEIKSLKEQVNKLQEEKSELENKGTKDGAQDVLDTSGGDQSGTDLQEQLDLINEELNETVTENEELRGQIATLSMKVQMLQSSQSPTKDSSIDGEGQAKIQELEEQLHLVNEDLNEAMTENDHLKAQIFEMNARMQIQDKLEHDVKTRQAAPSAEGPGADTSNTQELQQLRENLSKLSGENEKLRAQLQVTDAKGQMFDTLQKEYDSVNEQYNKILTDNSGMAKKIEELHQRLQLQGTQEVNTAYMNEQHSHLAKEKQRLISHIDNLEKQIQELADVNTGLDQEVMKLKAAQQQLVFDNDTLKAQMVLTRSDGGQTEAFQTDYQRLQGQFTTAMEQKNQIQAEWNQAMHSLKQREARCQQLAMQVSQLAEDRSYLNKQLGHLSKSLREREQELQGLQQQYRILYQTHLSVQAKILETERKAVDEAMQRACRVKLEAVKISPENVVVEKVAPNEVKLEIDDNPDNLQVADLRTKLEEAEQMRIKMQDHQTRLEKTLTAEREQRLQLEESLATLQEHIKMAAENKDVGCLQLHQYWNL